MNRKVPLTRRQFLGRVSLAAGVAPTMFAWPVTAGAGRAREVPSATGATRPAVATPIVSFHVDQPYLDKTGTAVPYVPPAGTRSGQAVSELSDVEYLSRHLYF